MIAKPCNLSLWCLTCGFLLVIADTCGLRAEISPARSSLAVIQAMNVPTRMTYLTDMAGILAALPAAAAACGWWRKKRESRRRRRRQDAEPGRDGAGQLPPDGQP